MRCRWLAGCAGGTSGRGLDGLTVRIRLLSGEGLTPEQLDRVQAWEATLVDVIKQEMLHLALATNILTAIGAAPHFERPNLPILSRWYPPEVQIAFLPFGERALRHFMYLERPGG